MWRALSSDAKTGPTHSARKRGDGRTGKSETGAHRAPSHSPFSPALQEHSVGCDCLAPRRSFHPAASVDRRVIEKAWHHTQARRMAISAPHSAGEKECGPRNRRDPIHPVCTEVLGMAILWATRDLSIRSRSAWADLLWYVLHTQSAAAVQLCVMVSRDLYN